MSELFPAIEITCLDKPRWLKEDLYAQMQFEKLSDKESVTDCNLQSVTDMVCRLLGLIRAGNRMEDIENDGLTVEELAAMIDASNVEAVLEVLLKALNQGNEEVSETPEDPGVKEGEVVPFTPAGSDSGVSDEPTLD